MGSYDSSWNICTSSSVIIAASVFETWCRQTDSHRQTEVKTLPHDFRRRGYQIQCTCKMLVDVSVKISQSQMYNEKAHITCHKIQIIEPELNRYWRPNQEEIFVWRSRTKTSINLH